MALDASKLLPNLGINTFSDSANKANYSNSSTAQKNKK